jgi:hypothetical protein
MKDFSDDRKKNYEVFVEEEVSNFLLILSIILTFIEGP